MSKSFKLVVTVPESHADAVRFAMAEAGAGQIGNYKGCSFSSKGIGRFIPLEGAQPAIGVVGLGEEVVEERVEVNVDFDQVESVMSAIRSVHPYDEPVIDLYPLADGMDRISTIEERNARVEMNKAWEGSFTRRGLLVLFTYLAVGLYLSAINVDRPWVNAIVPSVGFLLSTLTLPFFKRRWIRTRSSISNSRACPPLAGIGE